MNFSSVGLPDFLLQSLGRMSIEAPTNVQSQVIPVVLEGKDALVTAYTGSGKTLAYLLPLISRVSLGSCKKILVLAPTRELASQISDVAIKCLTGSQIRVACLVGGQSMVVQLKQLQRKPQVIIGTPGRVFDHISRKTLQLQDANAFVLDEMDRMLDLGFSQQIEEIENFLPKERQTLMLSATLPVRTKRLAEKYLTDHVRITDGDVNKPAPKIDHSFERVAGSEKFANLLTQINQREGTVMVFVNRKIDAQKIAGKLKDEGLRADSIHGDLRQNVRDRIIRNLREQKIRVMVGTDVVARGLDVGHIRHVINYDLPMCPEDYLHRIGRTGRAGETGSAFSLVEPQDNARWRSIQRLLNVDTSAAGDTDVEQEDFRRPRSGGGGRRGGGRFGGGGNRFGGGGNFGGGNNRSAFASKNRSSQSPYKKRERFSDTVDADSSFSRQGNGNRFSDGAAFGKEDDFFVKRVQRAAFGENREQRPAFGGNREYRERRPSFGDNRERPFGENRERSFGENRERPFGENRERRPSFGGNRPAFGEDRQPRRSRDGFAGGNKSFGGNNKFRGNGGFAGKRKDVRISSLDS